jgi:hypothetical protein
MSRFQEKSETVYVAYNPTELNQYSSQAYIEANCKGNIQIYNNINNEFNPKIVPVFKQGDRITPTQPFFGKDGLSLQLDIGGNLFLRHITDNQVDGNLWMAGCPSAVGVGSNFKLQGVYGCSGGQIVDTTINEKGGNILLNPYCQIDLCGNLVCYGCTIASGKPTPYMSFVNEKSSVNDSTLNLIIDGSYSLPSGLFGGGGTGKNMAGNLTIIAGNNYIVNSTIADEDYQLLKGNLQTTFDKAKECNNAEQANALVTQHNEHVAATQLFGDAAFGYNIQYIHMMNLTVGIFVTMGYVYYLYKKK